jgi:hypothetical protein
LLAVERRIVLTFVTQSICERVVGHDCAPLAPTETALVTLGDEAVLICRRHGSMAAGPIARQARDVCSASVGAEVLAVAAVAADRGRVLISLGDRFGRSMPVEAQQNRLALQPWACPSPPWVQESTITPAVPVDALPQQEIETAFDAITCRPI